MLRSCMPLSVLEQGGNRRGQLGLGHTQQTKRQLHTIKALQGKRVNVIACGDDFSLAACVEQEVFVWGWEDR